MTAPSYTTFTGTVAPGAMRHVSRQGSFLTCLAATHAFELGFGDNPRSEFAAGLTFETASTFDKVTIYNPSTRPLTFTVGIGRGMIRDSRLTLGGTIGVQSERPLLTRTIGATVLRSLPDLSIAPGTTATIPAVPGRRDLWLYAWPISGAGANGQIRILGEGSDPATRQGFPLNPYETLRLAISGEVSLHSVFDATFDINRTMGCTVTWSEDVE